MGEDISRDLRNARAEILSHVMTFYHRDNFLSQLETLELNRKTSDFASLKFQLKKMMEARSFPADVIENLSRAEKNNLDVKYFRERIIELVPTYEELLATLLESLYKLYLEFPGNENFLSRIVRRITSDAFPNDSLRMKIIKQFIINTDYHTESVALRTGKSDKAQIIAALTEDIFSRPQVKNSDWQKFFTDWQKRRKTNYFKIESFSDIQGTAEVREKNFLEYLSKFNLVDDNGNIVCRLSDSYRKEKIAFLKIHGDFFEILGEPGGVGKFFAKLNEYAAFLERKISLPNKRSKEILETLEKNFIATINQEEYRREKQTWLIANYAEKCEAVLKKNFMGRHGADEKIFNEFLNCQIISQKPMPAPATLTPETVAAYLKQFHDSNQTSIGHIFLDAWKNFRDNLPYMDMVLMRLADSLANADFNRYGSLKAELYRFAFAFDMGFSGVDKVHDISNLLYDFYNDNFLRFENQPIGDGINFKNYAEIIFLYWLNKKNLTPAQKLARAEKFIDDVHKTAAKMARSDDVVSRARILANPEFPSDIYRQNFFEDILELDENRFKNYLLEHYHIYRPDNNNRIMIASETRTLEKCLRELVAKINSYPAENLDNYLNLKTKPPKDSDVDYLESCGMDIENLIGNLPRTETLSENAEFITWLKKMQDSLDVNRRILGNENFFKQPRYSRTDLIALYYFWFSNFAGIDWISDNEVVDWEELIDAFLNGFVDSEGFRHDGLNDLLANCGLQLFSSKILYDNFILFYLLFENIW